MFTYKGIRSSEMGLRVSGDLNFNSPVRDVNLVTVAGRNGDLVMDNGRFASVIRSIPCRLNVPKGQQVESLINEITNWLGTDIGFHDFTWSGDPEFVYQVMIENSVSLQRLLPEFGEALVKFRMHPIKYLISSLNERAIANGTNIANPYQLPAKPVIRVIGNGDLLLNIGNQVLDLRDIHNGIIVDCETMTVTGHDGNTTEFDKMYSTFPEIRTGNNTVMFGGDFQVFITSRLGVLV